MAITS
jgi:hypothetical protein